MIQSFQNFLRGAGSILCLFPVPFSERVDLPSLRFSDEELFQMDWLATWNDLRSSIDQWNKESSQHASNES